MSFNRLKEIGQELAVVALSLGDGDEARHFMLSNAFTPVQCQRFQWGVGIVNAVTASWLVTTCVQNRDQAVSFRLPNGEPEGSPKRDSMHRTPVDCDRNILTMKIDGVLNLFHFKERVDSGKIEIGFRSQRK